MSHIALSTRALASVPTSVFLEKSVVGSDLSDIWVLNLLVVSVLRVKVLVTSTSTLFLVLLGLVRAVASASYCSTLNSSISASTLCTFTAIFLELAPLFLVILRLMTHV